MKLGKQWKQIGWCGVDSGTILIADPCYVLSNPGEDRHDYITYEKLFEGFFKDGSSEPAYAHKVIKGVGGDGVVVQTAWGDGSYPVYGLIGKDEFGHKVIKQVLIDFLPDGE